MAGSLVGKIVRAGRARVLLALLPMMLALTIGAGAALAAASSDFHSNATVGQVAAAWGNNEFGQLGNGASGAGADRNKPVGVGGGLSAQDIKALDGGANHSVALKTDGTVWAWGRNNVGEVGNGTNTTTGCNCISTPVQVVNPSDPSGFLQGVITIAVGGDHALALVSDGTGDGVPNDGTVWAWGFNGLGALGNGTSGNSSNVPVQVHDPSDPSGFLQDVTAVAAGASHSFALKSDGTVRSWGANNTGQLGNGTSSFGPTTTPVTVSGLSGVKALAGGGNLSLALKTDGTVMSWGSNNSGELGNGTSGGFSTVPVSVSNLRGVRAIDAGGNFGLAIKKTRKGNVVRSWGGNTSGQLGNGTFGGNPFCSCSNVPVAVSGLKGVKAISAGGDFSLGNHGLALRSDGTVVAWGANESGQLGNGDDALSDRNTPVKVVNLSSVTGVAAGGYHSLAK